MSHFRSEKFAKNIEKKVEKEKEREREREKESKTFQFHFVMILYQTLSLFDTDSRQKFLCLLEKKNPNRKG